MPRAIYSRISAGASSARPRLTQWNLRDLAAFAATVFKRAQIAASGTEDYWFGTCGVAGAAGAAPLVAGGVEPAAGAVAGAVAGAAASLPDGGVGVALPAGAGVVVPGNWLSTPLPAAPSDVAGTRSRMSIGFSP